MLDPTPRRLLIALNVATLILGSTMGRIALGCLLLRRIGRSLPFLLHELFLCRRLQLKARGLVWVAVPPSGWRMRSPRTGGAQTSGS